MAGVMGQEEVGTHLVFVAIVGLVETFSKPVELSEARYYPHTLGSEVKPPLSSTTSSWG